MSGEIAYGYIRVSTKDQAEDGVSLDAQREKIAAYCALHDLHLVEVFADEGLSGKRADNRPGLQAALDAVCGARAVLITYSLSRIARSTKDCIAISERLDKAGANLAIITEKVDTSSSMGRFFFRLMASLAELERDQISDRTKAAMSHLRSQDRRISPRIPFGKRLADDGVHLVDDEHELTACALIMTMRQSGMSFSKIGKRLTDEGIRTKGGGPWYPATIRDILIRRERDATERAKHERKSA